MCRQLMKGSVNCVEGDREVPPVIISPSLGILRIILAAWMILVQCHSVLEMFGVRMVVEFSFLFLYKQGNVFELLSD